MTTNSGAIALRLLLQDFGELTDENYPYMRNLVYLMQAHGIDLVVPYGWFNRRSGVNTQKLYHYFCEAKYVQGTGEAKLVPYVEVKLTKVKDLLSQKPELITIQDWASVLTNYHFLMTVSKLSKNDAIPYIDIGHYHIDAAEAALKASGLLDNAG